MPRPARCPCHSQEREVFLDRQAEPDNNPVDALELVRPDVAEVRDVSTFVATPHRFLVRRTVDVETMDIKSLAPQEMEDVDAEPAAAPPKRGAPSAAPSKSRQTVGKKVADLEAQVAMLQQVVSALEERVAARDAVVRRLETRMEECEALLKV